jgi:hypothetical protein
MTRWLVPDAKYNDLLIKTDYPTAIAVTVCGWVGRLVGYEG